MKLLVEIDLTNEAFNDGSPALEVFRILKTVVQWVDVTMPGEGITLRDSNGNTVGYARKAD